MGMNFQLHRASVHFSRGLRQIHKASDKAHDGNYDSAAKHLDKGLNQFADAVDNFRNAEDDAAAKVVSEIDKGKEQLQKAKDAYVAGNYDSSDRHLEKAGEYFDEALDLLD